MSDNKHNLQYFETRSMRELFDAMQAWQVENKQRFLSLSIEREENAVCCIALTNPSEVIIVDGGEVEGVYVSNGALSVKQARPL